MTWTAHADEDALAADRRQTLVQLYSSFNARDIDAVLAHLAPGVDWPNGWKGGRVHGRDAVRDYWLGQWKEINPRVEPLEIDIEKDGKARVRVDQLVRSLDGKVISNHQLDHVYEFDGPFITRMTIVDSDKADDDTEE
jgi:hypothetical protein